MPTHKQNTKDIQSRSSRYFWVRYCGVYMVNYLVRHLQNEIMIEEFVPTHKQNTKDIQSRSSRYFSARRVVCWFYIYRAMIKEPSNGILSELPVMHCRDHLVRDHSSKFWLRLFNCANFCSIKFLKVLPVMWYRTQNVQCVVAFLSQFIICELLYTTNVDCNKHWSLRPWKKDVLSAHKLVFY
jgi:hypothetical protein